MSIMLVPGLSFCIVNDDVTGNWNAWIVLSDGARVVRSNMPTKRVAFEWVETTYATWLSTE